MPKHVPVGTRRKFGPYKGSAEHDGRPIYVWKIKAKDGWKTESSDKARVDYEDSHHTKLSKDTDVDHKDDDKRHDALSNLQAMSHSANVAKENKRRAGK